MRFAYADPPYPGMANLYPEKTEVDHGQLIQDLCDQFPDGWALSTASTTLQVVLALCPEDVRIGGWGKSFASFKPGVNPAYAWEPVIFRGGRKRDRTELTVRDWHISPITLRKGLIGAKPESFCFWIADLLGARDEDEIVDIYPGTGVMGRTRQQRRLTVLDGDINPYSLPWEVYDSGQVRK